MILKGIMMIKSDCIISCKTAMLRNSDLKDNSASCVIDLFLQVFRSWFDDGFNTCFFIHHMPYDNAILLFVDVSFELSHQNMQHDLQVEHIGLCCTQMHQRATQTIRFAS